MRKNFVKYAEDLLDGCILKQKTRREVCNIDNAGGYWDALYSDGAHADASYDGWLDTFRDVLARAGRVLELGAGDGADTGFLRSACASVISCDLSDAALSRLKHRYPGAETMWLNLTEPMVFGKGTFEAVVADLCLHYFPLQKTREIFAELHRVVAPGGWLFLRVNAREEYVPAPEDVRLETDYYVTRGCARRYFSKEGLEELLSGFRVVRIQRESTGKYGARKHMWMAAAVREE